MIVDQIKVCCGRSHAEPFRFEMGGATWIGATDGWLIAAVQTDDVAELAAAQGRAPGHAVASVFPASTDGRTCVSLAALRAWCGGKERRDPCPHCNGTRRLECEECKGTGRLAHDCDCDHCTIDDDGPCDECGASGNYACEECEDGTLLVDNPGVISGLVVNRNLLLRLCVAAPDVESLAMFVYDRRLAFSAPQWRGLVMGMSVDPTGLDVFGGAAPSPGATASDE